MSLVNNKIKSAKKVLELSELTKTCEKAKVPAVKAEALRRFEVFEKFLLFEYHNADFAISFRLFSKNSSNILLLEMQVN